MNQQAVHTNGHPSAPITLIVDTPEAFKEVTYHFGVLIPPHAAAKMAGVTNQRIQNLIAQGKFTKIVVYGGVHISQIEFEKWNLSPRRAGRPRQKKNISTPDETSSEQKVNSEHSGEVPGNGYQPPTFSTQPNA